MSHVAEEFPELCQTERDAFAEILGTHVQRLATIVNGDCACTTHVPLNLKSLTLRRTARAEADETRRSLDMTATPDTSTHKIGEPLSQDEAIASLGRYGYGWVDSDVAGASAKRGLSEDVVRDISAKKNEPEWMLQQRLKALRIFDRKPMPKWGSNLEGIDFDNIKYFVRSTEKQAASWDDLPDDIKNTYDRLGIPEAEKQRLVSGVAAQYECMAGDTLVWTANRGQVPIKEIAYGDRVFAYDELSERFVVAPVKASAQTDTRQTFEVKTMRRSIRATDNHPMLVLRDERKPGSSARALSPPLGHGRRDQARRLHRGAAADSGIRCRRRSFRRCGLADARRSVSVDLMWLLGLYIGDGNLHLSTKTYRVQFAIPATDVELRAEIARVVKELFGLRCIAADEYRVVVELEGVDGVDHRVGFAGLSLTKRFPTGFTRCLLISGWHSSAAGSTPTGM